MISNVDGKLCSMNGSDLKTTNRWALMLLNARPAAIYCEFSRCCSGKSNGQETNAQESNAQESNGQVTCTYRVRGQSTVVWRTDRGHCEAFRRVYT